MSHSWQIVDSIATSPTVLLDFDDRSPFTVVSGSVSPPQLRRSTSQSLGDGSAQTDTAYDDRIIKLKLNVWNDTAEVQSTAIQELARLLDRREGLWIKWQSEGKTLPVFFRTKRADLDVIDLILSSSPERDITLEIPCDPFAYGLPESGFFTVNNNPTAGVNPMSYVFGGIKGDVATPLHLSFPTSNAAHRIHVASQAEIGSPAGMVASDTFTRADSTSTMGSTEVGGLAWTAHAGTWGISSNAAYCPTPHGSLWSVVTADAGLSDGVVEATLTTVSSSGLFVRATSATNGIAIFHNALFTIIAGVYTGPIAHSATFVSGDRMRAVMAGNVVTVYRQVAGLGAWTQVNTVTSAPLAANTQHGLMSSTPTPRFDNFTIMRSVPATPYYKSLSAETKDATPPTGWTITDAADTNMVSGTRRRMEATGATPGIVVVPTAATSLTWDNLPAGDYRAFIRIGFNLTGADIPEVLLYNRPPSDGVTYTREEAASIRSHTYAVGNPPLREWLDMGVVSMPGGAPPTDPAFDLAGATGTTMWQVAIREDDSSTYQFDLDAIVLVPAGRAETVTRHGSLSFPDTYTNKVVTLDGVNNRRFASGQPLVAAGTTTTLAPSDAAGGLPVVVPNASNTLHFFAVLPDNTAGADRMGDDKTITTLITYKYFPRYLYDRPSAS